MQKEFVINYKPTRVQRLVHFSKAQFKVLCWGTRTGKTKCAVYEAFMKMSICTGGAPTKGWIVAPNYTLTGILERQLVELVRPFLKNPELKTSPGSHRYELITGDVFETKSADTDNLVGEDLDWVIFDEIARARRESWFSQLRQRLMDRRGTAVLISTPFLAWFEELFNMGQDPKYPNYESWRATPYDNYDEETGERHVPIEEIDAMKNEMGELEFWQEILAEFINDSNRFIRNVEACIYYDKPQIEFRSDKVQCDNCGIKFKPDMEFASESGYDICHLCKEKVSIVKEDEDFFYIGVDLADKNDFTVITVSKLNEEHNKIIVIETDRFNKVGWTIQLPRIKRMYDKYHNSIIVMDSTGVGDPVLDMLRGAGIPIIGKNFNNKFKTDLATRVSIVFENELIEIPNDPILINELKIFEATKSDTGKWTYSAPERKHDDHVISLGLSICGIYIGGLKPLIEIKEDNK